MSEIVRTKKSVVSFSVSHKSGNSGNFEYPSFGTEETHNNNSVQNSAVKISQKLQEEYDRGFSDAKSQLESEMLQVNEQKIKTKTQQIDAFISNLTKELQNFKNKTEQLLPKYAIAIAEKVIKQQVETSNKIILSQINEAVRRIVGADKIRIRLNPLDEINVREAKGNVVEGVDSIREIIIEADEKIERGGCIIESEMGNVDAKISTQLNQIENAFE